MLFAALTALFLVVTAAMSYLKLLWLDELITLHLARTGSPGALWQALKQGADPNPPRTHLLVMLCRHLFGEHAYVLRMPAIAGYWLGMLFLFAFLKRRVPAAWALLGVIRSMCISMCIDGFEWSFESRSYALFYGTTMAALTLWICPAEPSQTQPGDASGSQAAPSPLPPASASTTAPCSPLCRSPWRRS